jgi:hypothetical protein
MNLWNWIKYSGATITLKLNPLHWRFSCKFIALNEAWETDHFLLELFPITIRVWFDDGSW